MRGPLGAVIGRYPSSDGNAQMGGIIRHNRKCRDIVFLVIFIAFWVGMIVNSSFGFNQAPGGITQRLARYLLGISPGSITQRWLDSSWGYHSTFGQIAPGGVSKWSEGQSIKLADARSICLMDCPTPSEDSLNWVCDYPEGEIRLSMDDWIDRNYDYFEFLTPEMRNSSVNLQGPCYPVIFPSVNVYWSCQFLARPSNVSLTHWKQMGGMNIDADLIIDKSIHKSTDSRSSVLKRYMSDIGKSWPILIVCGGILPLFLAVIWLLMIRHFVAAMPWVTVVLFNILIVSVTMFYYLKAGWIGNDAITPIIGDHDPYVHIFGRELDHMRAAAVLMTFVMAVSVLTSIAIIRRIIMATSVLKATAKNNCNSNCCAYDLASKRVNCDRCCGYSIRYTPHIDIAIFFHLFGGYWATQFFVACSSTVIAGSVASYYWARGETSPEIPFLPVFSSMKRLARYNLGSMAIGSLTVSFMESIRFILESIRRKLKVTNTTPDSWIGRAAHNTSRFCLRCIEWIIKSVNRNAYIMIAITGKSFCKASAIATELIMNNILRIGRVNVIGDVILFLGKLCISLSSALFAFLMSDTHKYRSAHNKISSPLFPVLVCWGLGYVVATLFFGVVEMSIDTIILSYCQDSEEHQGTAQYAPPLLMETLNDQNEMQRLTQGPPSS
ncbi:Choline transporter protein 1, partial [Cucurbita argyrosperma subsp. sororia]